MKQAAIGLAIALMLFVCDGYGQTSTTNVESTNTGLITRKVEGEITNEFQGTLTIEWPEGKPTLAEAMVEVVSLSNIDTTAPERTKQWLEEVLDHVNHNDWWYFKATNGFCGPIEMRDSTGQKVKLLRPEVSSNEAYPSSYKLDGSQQRYMKQYRVSYSRPGAAYPDPWEQPELARFRLFDYFEITNSGEYQLTVWPKVYVKTSTNTFDCKLIDVPPVTATFTFRR
jgi:hypothetical protein